MTDHPEILALNDNPKYRAMPGFPGYWIGSDGSVMSSRTVVPLGNGKGTRSSVLGRIKKLKIRLCRAGYPVFVVRDNSRKTVNIHVHRAVLLAFVGPPPEGHQAAHENGIRTDNRLENLSWKTASENQLDRIRHGTHVRGEKNSSAKITEDIVRAIRKEHIPRGKGRVPGGRKTMGCTRLAKKYGLSEGNVARILNGKAWSHVK